MCTCLLYTSAGRWPRRCRCSSTAAAPGAGRQGTRRRWRWKRRRPLSRTGRRNGRNSPGAQKRLLQKTVPTERGARPRGGEHRFPDIIVKLSSTPDTRPAGRSGWGEDGGKAKKAACRPLRRGPVGDSPAAADGGKRARHAPRAAEGGRGLDVYKRQGSAFRQNQPASRVSQSAKTSAHPGSPSRETQASPGRRGRRRGRASPFFGCLAASPPLPLPTKRCL